MLSGVVHCISDNHKSKQSGVFSSKIHEGGWGEFETVMQIGNQAKSTKSSKFVHDF